MIETTGKSITFWTHFVAAKQGKTGLTVTVSVRGPGITGTITGNAIEDGDGLYYYTLTNAQTTVAGSYRCMFKTNDVTVEQQWLPSYWAIGVASVDDIAPTRTASQNAEQNALNAYHEAYLARGYTSPVIFGVNATQNIRINTPNVQIVANDWLCVMTGNGAGQARRIVSGQIYIPDGLFYVTLESPLSTGINLNDMVMVAPAGVAMAWQQAYMAGIAAQSVDTKLTTERTNSLDNLDAPISLVVDGINSLDDAQGIATAVRTNLATELGRIDAPISSVVDGINGLDDAQDIAAAVRTNLATELGRIDVPISLAVSSLSGTTSVNIAFHDASNAPVGGVAFTIEGMGSAVSASNGTITIGLDAGTYTLNARPQNGIIFPSTNFTVTEEPTNVNITGTVAALPDPPVEGDTCTITLQLVNWSGDEKGYLDIVNLPTKLAAGWMTQQKEVATVSASGLLVWTEIPNGAWVNITVPEAKINKQVQVPEGVTLFAI